MHCNELSKYIKEIQSKMLYHSTQIECILKGRASRLHSNDSRIFKKRNNYTYLIYY